MTSNLVHDSFSLELVMHSKKNIIIVGLSDSAFESEDMFMIHRYLRISVLQYVCAREILFGNDLFV